MRPSIIRDLLICRTGVILLFGLIAAVCRTADIAAYRSQADAAKLVFVSHIAYFLIFLGTMVPYSIGMVKVLFAPGAPSALLEAPTYRSLLFPITLQLAMYVFEVSDDGWLRSDRSGPAPVMLHIYCLYIYTTCACVTAAHLLHHIDSPPLSSAYGCDTLCFHVSW